MSVVKRLQAMAAAVIMLSGMQMPFAVNAEENITKLVQYDMKEFVNVSGNTAEVENTLDSTKNQLKRTYNSSVSIKPIYEITYPVLMQNYIAPGSGWAFSSYIEGEEFAPSLNNGFTYEGWINQPYYTGEDNLFCIGTEKGSRNENPAFKVWFGPQSGVRDVNILYIQKKFKNADGDIKDVMYTITGVPTNTWKHLVITWPEENATTPPICYINGVKQTPNRFTDALTEDYLPVNYDNQYFNIGGSGYDGMTSRVKLASQSIYAGIMNDTQVQYAYAESMPLYETVFDIQIKDENGEIISVDSLNTVPVKRTSISINLQSADIDTANKETIRLINVTDNTISDYSTNVSDGIYTMTNLGLIEGKSYKITIDGIKDTEGNEIRTTAQNLNFTTKEKLVPLAEWDMNNAYALPNSATLTIENSLDSSKYAIKDSTDTHVYGFGNVNEITYNKQRYIKPMTSNCISAVSSDIDFGEELNGGFTYEGWINMSDALGTQAPYIFSIESNGQIVISLRIVSSGQRIVFIHKYADGNTYQWWNNTNIVLKNVWNHIVVSYDNSDLTNIPSIYLNGQKLSMTKYTGTMGNEVIPFEKNITVRLNSTDTYSFANMGLVSLYSKVLSEEEITERYYLKKSKFEKEFDIKLYNSETLIEENNLDFCDNNNLNAVIDFTGADMSTVSEAVKLYKGEEQIVVDGVVEENSYKINLDMLDKGEYTLVIGTQIKDLEGAFIKTAEQTLDFVVDEAFNINSVGFVNQDDIEVVTPQDLTNAVGIKAKASVKDLNENKKNMVMLVAVYDEGSLVNVVKTDKTYTDTGYDFESELITLPVGKVTVKAMLWDGIETMIPYDALCISE